MTCKRNVMDSWFIEKSLNDKIVNNVKTLLFDFVPIENYIFSLLHVEISFGNKIVYIYFDWISERIEPITDDELELTNFLIDLKIELNKHEGDYDEWIKNYSSLLAELRLDRQGIICLLNERDDNNKFIINGMKERIALNIEKNLANKIDNLSKEKT